MKTVILRNWEQILEISPQWNNLLKQSNSDTVFLTWEWIDAWRKTVGDSIKPLVIAVYDPAGSMAGLGPFYQADIWFARMLRLKCLRVLGDYPTGGEYQDWIVRKEFEGPACDAIARTLAENRDCWDLMWLPLMSGWTGACERLTSACTREKLRFQRRDYEFSAIDLPEEYADYKRILSRNSRKKLNRYERIVLNRAKADFQICRNKQHLQHYLSALVDLNTRRWQAAGQTGTFVRKPLEARFYANFAHTCLERGWLFFSAMQINGGIQAVDIGYIYNNIFHSLQGGFDPEAPTGIGHVIRSKVIEHLIRKGVKTYDFMSDFSAYKQQYGATKRMGHQMLIGRPGAKTTPVFAGSCWPGGRILDF